MKNESEIRNKNYCLWFYIDPGGTFSLTKVYEGHFYKFTKTNILNGVFTKKYKGLYIAAYVEKYSLAIATNLNSICCVYKEKIVKATSHTE